MLNNYGIRESISSIKAYTIKNKVDFFKQFMFGFILISWCYLGLLLTNYFFSDDLTRFPNGNIGWMQDARYAMQILYQFLNVNFSFAITSASSYTYFLTTACLSLSTLILANYFNKKNIYISILISSLVVITPFYWYWMLYIYDRLPMSLSLLMAVVTTLFVYHLDNKQSFILQTVLLLFLLYMYQVALLAFMVIASFLFLYNLVEIKQSFKVIFNKLLISIISLTTAMVTYKVIDKFVISNFGFKQEMLDYSKGALNFYDRLAQLPSRFQDIVNLLSDFNLQWRDTTFFYLSLLIMMFFIPLMLYNFFKTKPKLSAITLFLFVFLLVCLGYVTLILLTPLIHRFFTPFTLTISLALLYFYNNSDKILNKIAIALTVVITMNCLSMASYLADYLQKQSEHQAKIGALLEEDFYQAKQEYPNIKTIVFVNPKNIIKKVELEGSPIYLPIIRNYLQRIGPWSLPMKLTSIVTYWWDGRATSNFETPATEKHIEVIDRRYYKINYFTEKEHLEIVFKESKIIKAF